ncbi:unnamed protein product [Schistosoma mattheei]|uniref:Uncharacterized protein n=1 Tax=Schistosoma mattheei TaxID=31246 RepID=A0A183Q154_9TREM|nr:unnamed protein product [Schistosoma mattheei]
MNYPYDLNSSRTIEIMVLKLLTHIQQEWLKEQADIANTRYGLPENCGSNSDSKGVGILKGKINADYNAVRISYANTSDDNVPLRSSSCLEFSGNQPLDHCQKFKNKYVREGKEFVLRHKLCIACLKTSYEAKNRRSLRSCAAEGCAWRHHTLLHRNQEEQRDGSSDVYNNTQIYKDGSGRSIQRPVAFTSVPVYSESDTSVIVDGLADELGIEGKPKLVSLGTLSNESSLVSKEVDVKLNSQEDQERIEKVTKPKVKAPKTSKATVTKKPVTKTLKKHAAHILRGVVHGVEKGAFVRVVNKRKAASGSLKEANASLGQIMCSWKQNKISNALLERGCE